ncbi:MAG: hypothetical protein QM811_16005 [Pirellulales bacterium]
MIALSHYFDLNETWTSRDGQTWSIPRVLKEEIEAPIRGVACGGTHRLFGITYAYQQRLKRGQPLDGEYARAKQHIENYQKYAWSLMNPDGSFSTNWFKGAENKSDVDRKVQTTGHCMEWLILSQTDEELRSPRMIKSIDYLTTALKNDPRRDWKLGPLGHALHSLVMYNERVFKAQKVPPELAAGQSPRTADAGTTKEFPKTDVPMSPLPPKLDGVAPMKDVEAIITTPETPKDAAVLPNTAPEKKEAKDEGQDDEQGDAKKPADKTVPLKNVPASKVPTKSTAAPSNEPRTAAASRSNVGPQAYPAFDTPSPVPMKSVPLNPFEDPANDPPSMKR